MDAQHFKTTEAILAFSLDIAGCEFLDPGQPCANIFDAEILGKLGYRGKPLWEAANEAWEHEQKGHVEYIFKQTPRLLELIRAYREQCDEIAKPGGNATNLIEGIILGSESGSQLMDEAILRVACVILKTRGDFMNIYKKMVPLLRIPETGKTKHLPTAKDGENLVQKPGYKFVSLNASEETKRHLGL